MKSTLNINKSDISLHSPSRKASSLLRQSSSVRKRQARSKRRYNYNEPWLRKYMETFISQCIVCAIILASILVLRIIQIPETLAIREQIYTTIGTNVDIAYEARNLGAMLMAVIGTDENTAALTPDTDLYPPEILPVIDSETDNSFRIDEDILLHIHSRESEDLLEFREYRNLP